MSKLEQAWQRRTFLALLLWPVSLVMQALVVLRRLLYRLNLLRTKKALVPVVVVGNISVGGTGKSPLTAALVNTFQEMDWRPGIVARGYGGNNIKTPQHVLPTSNPADVGDEPVMLAQSTGVPVCVCADRAAAVQAIVQQHNVDIVFSDDGLQHYAMARDAEIVVVDEARGFGNGWLLPAGPLREPISRLKKVSLIAYHRTSTPADDFANANSAPADTDTAKITTFNTTTNSATNTAIKTIPSDIPSGDFHLIQTYLQKVNCAQEEHLPVSILSGRKVHAVAGIGDPARFFRQLMRAGVDVIEHPKPDHHVWSVTDLQFSDEHPIVITSKDAVKVKPLMKAYSDATPIYEVCVKAVLSPVLSNAVADIEDRLHTSYRQTQQGIR